MNNPEFVRHALTIILKKELTPFHSKYLAWMITLQYLQAPPDIQKQIEQGIQNDLDQIEKDRQQTEKYLQEQEDEYVRQHEQPYKQPYITHKKSFWDYINWLWI